MMGAALTLIEQARMEAQMSPGSRVQDQQRIQNNKYPGRVDPFPYLRRAATVWYPTS
jgi:hypothetical protein